MNQFSAHPDPFLDPQHLRAGASTVTLRLPQSNGSDSSSRTVSSVSDGSTSTNSIISVNVGKDASIELINVTKVSMLPLHDDDLLYESKADFSDGQRWPSNMHRTSVFRSISSKIWDPHPEYILYAFGHNMHLKLWHDDEFITKDMKVTHIWPNETLRKEEDHIESKMLQACYYKGVVVGDESSSVQVSLCDGMLGHISTLNGTFFIEPAESVSSNNNNVLHRIQRYLTDKLGSSTDARLQIDRLGIAPEDCAVHTEHEIAAGRELDVNRTLAGHWGPHRSRRSAPHFTNDEYTIEVLVAVDNKMQRYHGGALKSYVLTLMSIVSSVYADASIGNWIKIAVSHIMYIHQDLAAQNKSLENGLDGVSASQMLQDFCRLKQTTNFHHDVALILTREQICREPSTNNCDTLGLAELGTICRPTACAIVQDNGLSASFTIAHELGHVLGMPHDDDNRCQRFRGNSVGNDRIMSRTIDHNTHPWQWSSCSRHILTEYLEKNPNNCLLNHPTKDLIDPTEMDSKLAGEKFTNNKQCELVFGHGYKICSYMPVCTRLWCSLEDEMLGCKTQHMPWADGTECSDGHWCQKGQCVPIDRTVLQPQNGGWSHWSAFGHCSRSCGGGVQNRTRECDSPKPKNGGKFCAGLRIDYRTCNTQPCPDSRYNFREEQCHEHDGQTFDVADLKKNVQWIPKYGTKAEDHCKLHCRVRAKDVNMYFMLREKVIDGTPCTFPEDSFDMCINGQCRKAGCDYVLDSDAKLDRCGVCNGDNSTCREVHGYLPLGKLNKHHKQPYDNLKEFNIPKGATNINITHEGYSKDTCDNDSIFNDPKHPPSHASKHRLAAGVRLEYSTLGNHVERITSAFGRPLREKLTVKLFYKTHHYKHHHHHGQVVYSYLIPSHPLANVLPGHREAIAPQQHHQSDHSHHSPQHHRDHLSLQNSNKLQRAPQRPHVAELSYRWEMSSWMDCDQACSGKKRRTAACYNADTGQEVAPENCNETVKPQDLYEPCNTECKFYWEAGRTECSKACGEGLKQTEYLCVRKHLESLQQDYVDAALCAGIQKPMSAREQCEGSCKEAVWSYSPWTTCSCTDRTQNRSATCLSEPNGFQIDDSYCAVKERKDDVQTCNRSDCPRWITDNLTPCSVTCGEGQRAYALQCKLNNVTVNAALCGARPVAVIVNCTMPPCESKLMHNTQYSLKQQMKSVDYQPSYRWQCSAECGGGFKKRLVRCLSNTGQVMDDRYCVTRNSSKPVQRYDCPNVRCPVWSFGQWSQCNEQCKRSRQVLCQDHRGQASDQCETTLKPPAVESCCKFKWTMTCAGRCDPNGRRTPQFICKRVFPKSQDNEKPIKAGRKVDAKYCANAAKPSPSKPKKSCNKPCPFRWKTSPWSKCSAGCGHGWTVRNVTCTDGRTIAPKRCNAKLKPLNTKNCEAYTHCSWRSNRCNCKGKQSRSVKCYDDLLKVEANRCPDHLRPKNYTDCTPPAHCRNRASRQPAIPFRSCKDARRRHRTDGEYMMQLRGTSVRIYCHGMGTATPLEYLTLAAGLTENYAIYINRRAADANKCQTSSRDYTDESVNYGATHYRKVRIDLGTMRVLTDDFQFTNSSGKKQPFGSAGDCYSNTGHCPQGDFAINLEGTPFRIRPRTVWKTDGVHSVMKFLVALQPPYKKVRALCGGYCGSCSVSPDTHLYLELV
ncbi:A disintegrin and metalloproteinase with thrombospondin motifs 9 [Anopheles bellator]|uniref:A disintegrin and metalloproteinase with thrombospondin motifs 9 n=1 Tax=Anopheles bellator TaxID=139047 RepID=UPI0026499E6B|nr:A disintegrin and metalloproteinase with thrombospondin motifs 9 [Anopheles bellator]